MKIIISYLDSFKLNKWIGLSSQNTVFNSHSSQLFKKTSFVYSRVSAYGQYQ